LGRAYLKPLLVAMLISLLAPAIGHALNCPSTTITAVTPSLWVAGQTYDITVTGSGFSYQIDPEGQRAFGCGFEGFYGVLALTKSGDEVSFYDSSNDAWNYMAGGDVINDSQLTAKIKISASSSSQIACIVTGITYEDADNLGSLDAWWADVSWVDGTSNWVFTDSNCRAANGFPVQIVGGLSAAITDTSDIMNGNVTVKLTAPSGTTGDLNLIFNGSDASGQELSQVPFTALSPGSQDLKLTFDTILPGIYPMANGSWNAMLPGASTAQTVNVPDYTLPTQWTYFRKIFYTQYNVPHESACSGSDEDAWLVSTTTVKGKKSCNFKKIKLNSQFIAATWMNGTGIDLDGDTLKNAAAVNLGDMQTCDGQYPSGAIGHSRADGNTFEIVSSVAGSCNTTLVADQSLATPCSQSGKRCLAAVLSGVKALSCGDQLNLDNGDHVTASARSADDLCPACSDSSTFHGADGHIDAFSPKTSCTGRDVGSLGFFYTSYPTN
jgi:hypothetical protein